MVSDHFRGSGFAIFAKLLEQEGTEVRAIPAPKGGGSRKFCDRMNAFAQKEGLPGMGYIFWRDQGEGMEAAGPWPRTSAPNAPRRSASSWAWALAMRPFFLGGKPEALYQGRRQGPRDHRRGTGADRSENRFAFAWIVDFPIYEKDEETGRDRL